MDKPCQIFNCDETGMPLSPQPTKVVTAKEERHPYSIKSGDKSQVTVLVRCSAGGYPILQPLDNCCFGPLKRCWREEYQHYCSENPGQVVTRLQFS